MFDTGCIWDGYYSDFDRNFAIGSASAEAQDAHKKLFDATEAALSILRPGITPLIYLPLCMIYCVQTGHLPR
ncbi:MAG: hypothetical protein CM15mP95_3270 [Alphaproteobacteria bacterium]|nr:MAG: hypothetical protein CM15mP95_3270 [Alphaproteobacteria bacterium]